MYIYRYFFIYFLLEYEKLISKYMKRDDWYFWVSMSSGQVTMPTFQSLEAFWPGLLVCILISILIASVIFLKI